MGCGSCDTGPIHSCSPQPVCRRELLLCSEQRWIFKGGSALKGLTGAPPGVQHVFKSGHTQQKHKTRTFTQQLYFFLCKSHDRGSGYMDEPVMMWYGIPLFITWVTAIDSAF